MVEPCPLIDLSGPPHQRGVQHGRAAAVRIRKGIAHYTAQIARSGLGEQDIVGLVRDYLPIIESFDPLYIEEMQGIAVGAEVPFEHIALLNARTEILKLAERPDLRARLAENAPDGCTGVVVMQGASANRHILHAQNWDWKAECAETAVVLRIRREDGPDILTFTEAGGLARSGLNAAGIGLTANYLESDRDYRAGRCAARPHPPQGAGTVETPAMAMRAVYVTAKSAANNMMVSASDPTGQVWRSTSNAPPTKPSRSTPRAACWCMPTISSAPSPWPSCATPASPAPPARSIATSGCATCCCRISARSRPTMSRPRCSTISARRSRCAVRRA